MNKFTLYLENNGEGTSLDIYSYFDKVEDVKNYFIKNFEEDEIKENYEDTAEFSIVEINEETGDVINSYSLIELVWNETNSKQDVLAFLK